MLSDSKQKSILIFILSFVWIWFSVFVSGENFINFLTEPSTQAMRMTGTGGVSVVGGGNSTTSTSIKDRINAFANEPIRGMKGPQTPGTTSTIRGGTSVVGNSKTSSSSASASGRGGHLNRRVLPQNAHSLDRLNTQLVAEDVVSCWSFKKLPVCLVHSIFFKNDIKWGVCG